MYHITYITREEILHPKKIKYEAFFAYQGKNSIGRCRES